MAFIAQLSVAPPVAVASIAIFVFVVPLLVTEALIAVAVIDELQFAPDITNSARLLPAASAVEVELRENKDAVVRVEVFMVSKSSVVLLFVHVLEIPAPNVNA